MRRPRVVLVPGFTQTAASWQAVADVLRGTCDVATAEITVGDSFAATARELGRAGGRAIWAGYSMGGRLCLRLALDRPDLVEALVLVSASPGIADAAGRAERVASDEELACTVERDGVDAFLAQWLARPMFATVPAGAPGLAERRGLTAEFLASCLRVLGTGAMAPMWDDLPALAMPVMLVTGTLDAKFSAVARRMLDRMRSGAEHVELAGGHALPIESPAALAGVVAEFATRHGH